MKRVLLAARWSCFALLAELIRSETAKWSRVVKDSGAKVD